MKKTVVVQLRDCGQDIDTIEINEGYTEHEYIKDCEINDVDTSSFKSDFYDDGLNIDFIDAEFVIIDVKNGDSFEESFGTVEEALASAEAEWHHLTKYDKKQRDAYFVLKIYGNQEQEVKRWK